METRSSNRSERLLILLVTLICFGGAGAAGFALYSELTASGRAGSGAPMATVERRDASVRRKASGTFVWNNVNLLDELYRKDIVQTSGESSAMVRFNDNTVLEIGENSLVVIDDLKDLELGVMRGNLVVRSSSGESKRISVDAEGQARVEEIHVRLQKPEPLARLFSQASRGRQVEFAWSSKAPGPFKLEVSPDRAFAPDRTRAYEAKEAGASLELAPGRYFWRVSGAKGSSESRQLRVSQALPLLPVFPGPGAKVTRWGQDQSLQFRWAQPANELEGAHLLQVAEDAEFKSGVRESPLVAMAGAAVLEGIPAGRRFWRLRSQYGDQIVFSREQFFVTEAGQNLGLTLSYPESAARVELSQAALRFAWEAEGPVPDFRFELETADGKPVVSNDTASRSHSWIPPRAGPYRWRVLARSGSQSLGQTEWRTFSVQEGKPLVLNQPSDGQEVRYWESPEEFEFKWEQDSLAAKGGAYRLEIAREADFRDAQQFKTPETAFASEKAAVKPGQWYWRVAVIDARGSVLKTSDARRFAFGPHPVLKSPEVPKERVRTIYNPVDDERNPVLYWGPVEGSEGYEVTLIEAAQRMPAAERVLLKEQVDGTQLEIDARKFKPGQYEWRVRAIDRVKRLGEPSAPAKLEVTYGAPLDAPEVTSSEVQ